jgi:hypothetical protein
LNFEGVFKKLFHSRFVLRSSDLAKLTTRDKCVLGFEKGDLRAIIVMKWWQEELLLQ